MYLHTLLFLPSLRVFLLSLASASLQLLAAFDFWAGIRGLLQSSLIYKLVHNRIELLK